MHTKTVRRKQTYLGNSMRYTAFILDDEKSACQVLNSMLDEYCPEVKVIFVTQDPNRALDEISERQPQILFIDINMPKMSGFEFLEQITEFKGKIIFTTAYDQYAIQAFKYSAFDYLLKPIHVEQLEDTVSRLVKENNLSNNSDSIRELLTQVNQSTTLAIPQNGGKVFINIDEIMYLEGNGNYTNIFTENQKFTMAKTLKEFEESLDESAFLRIHKSYMVNMNNVEKLDAKNNAKLVLKSGVNVPVSRRKRHLLNRFTV